VAHRAEHHATVHPAPTPAALPSAAVETLQRELGRLDYYEGPITGTMNDQTVAAITYLQRDAHLPQTGTMDAATQQALVTTLAHGNNQMGS
jgi:peptidoglycan hydrolase-like protein with peptidoglycan-binding domain